MATDAETIASIKSAALAKIAAIQTRPDYNVDGQQILFQTMIAQLRQTVAWCNEMAGAEEPFETVTQMITE